MKPLIKYSSQLEKSVFDAAKKLADKQGRKLQSIINEALKDYLEKAEKPNPRVMEAFEKSKSKYDYVYKKLAE